MTDVAAQATDADDAAEEVIEQIEDEQIAKISEAVKVLEEVQKIEKALEETETETHIIKKETWISTDGTSKFTRTYSESKNQKPKVDVKVLESKLKEAIEK